MSKKSNFLTGLFMGTFIGGIAGILLAPSSGKETRDKLKEISEDVKDNLYEFGEQTMEQVNAYKENLSEKVEEVNDKVNDTVNSYKDQIEGKLEEIKGVVEDAMEDVDIESEEDDLNQ